MPSENYKDSKAKAATAKNVVAIAATFIQDAQKVVR